MARPGDGLCFFNKFNDAGASAFLFEWFYAKGAIGAAGTKALVRHCLPEGARGERFTLPEAYRSLAGAPPRTDAP